jgi:hypothetical protein
MRGPCQTYSAASNIGSAAASASAASNLAATRASSAKRRFWHPHKLEPQTRFRKGCIATGRQIYPHPSIEASQFPIVARPFQFFLSPRDLNPSRHCGNAAGGNCHACDNKRERRGSWIPVGKIKRFWASTPGSPGLPSQSFALAGSTGGAGSFQPLLPLFYIVHNLNFTLA